MEESSRWSGVFNDTENRCSALLSSFTETIGRHLSAGTIPDCAVLGTGPQKPTLRQAVRSTIAASVAAQAAVPGSMST